MGLNTFMQQKHLLRGVCLSVGVNASMYLLHRSLKLQSAPVVLALAASHRSAPFELDMTERRMITFTYLQTP